jgi:tocopherol cyclase
MLSPYRRTGADPPFVDPARGHGVGMEGYYWRFSDQASGRVVIALCGVCDRDWAVVAVAAHPGDFLRWEIVGRADVDFQRFGVKAGDVLRGDLHTLEVRLDGAHVDARIDPQIPWPRKAFGALGPAQLIPGLGQYWHPHLLRGTATGTTSFGPLPGTVYSEKNWGARFAPDWWWGQASDVGPARCVAFAGGRLMVGSPTCLVVALEDRVLRLSPPMTHVVTSTAPGRWRIRAGDVTVEAEAEEPHLLPVPVLGERRAELRSRQYLAGRLHIEIKGRFSAETELAGLERGIPQR